MTDSFILTDFTIPNGIARRHPAGKFSGRKLHAPARQPDGVGIAAGFDAMGLARSPRNGPCPR
ncbi:hypothetical protein [Luteolibacter sp. AS25]|uniref:hypothetical protein n=1 Tax=Luteolibacter sp. AS25 TaxID=3135776 RepID=UPI00398B1955